MTDSSDPESFFSFSRPVPFAGDREPAFERVTEKMAASIGADLTRLLRGQVEMEWTERVNEVPAAPDESALVFSLPAPTGDVRLVLAPDIVSILADLLMGAPRPAGERPLTLLERQVLKPVARIIAAACAGAGLPTGDPCVVDSGVAEPADPDAVAIPEVILRGRIRMDETSGGIELILPPFTARRLVVPATTGGEAISSERLGRLSARLSVTIDAGTLRLGDLRTLAPNDVVRLDPRPDDSLPVAVNGRPAGTARLSAEGSLRAVVLDMAPVVDPAKEEGGNG
ncbi:MAG: FliM/FliN family flagellar motor switch protein [Acidobacteriota bacterium]